MKRRTFLKTVGSAAGAATLGSPKLLAQNEPVRFRGKKVFGKHKQEETYGVGHSDYKPEGGHFALPKRMPGWFPDAADTTGAGSHDFMFLEETVKLTDNGPVPWALPDPVKPGTRWIVGDPIPDAPANPKAKPFICLIRALALKVRVYNASLYQLRRFHYYDKYHNDPGPNPHGDKRAIPDPKTDPNGFHGRVQAAEEDWNKAAKALNDIIDPPDPSHPPLGLDLVAVDMVQMNNYIVSMRVVAVPLSGAGKHPMEVGGSSSSHVLISSAFSSSSAP
jgi:hypothetical protein